MADDYISVQFKGKHLPTVISFSYVNTPKGSFKPYRMILPIEANIIFVNDKSNRWYQHGIEGVADCSMTAAQQLIKQAREMGNGRVVTFGTSMGAFGAILFAALGHADGCIAFGVEAVLKMEGSRSKQYMPQSIELPYPDLKPVLKMSKVPMFLYVSENDELDLYSAYHLHDVSSITSISIRGMQHPGVQVFDMDGSITKLLTDFASSGEAPLGFERQGDILEHQDLIRELFAGYYIKNVEKNPGKWLQQMLDIGERWPENSIGMLRLGEAQYRNRNEKAAEEAWHRAIELCPYQFEAHAKLGALLRKKGKTDRALEHLLTSVKINPWHAHGYHTLGQVYQDLGTLDEAEQYFRKAASLNPGNKDFQRSLALLLLQSVEQKTAEAKEILTKLLY